MSVFQVITESLWVLALFFIVYQWTAHRGLWQVASLINWPRLGYFLVWHLPIFWSYLSIFVLVGLVVLIEFGMTIPSWLWTVALAGVVADIDLLLNPYR